MADVTQSSRLVHPHDGANVKVVTAGTDCSAGNVLYKDTTDSNKYKPANATTAAASILAAVALTGATDGESMAIVTSGDVDVGGTLEPGMWYTNSTVAGNIKPCIDITGAYYFSMLGRATAADKLSLAIVNTSTALST